MHETAGGEISGWPAGEITDDGDVISRAEYDLVVAALDTERQARRERAARILVDSQELGGASVLGYRDPSEQNAYLSGHDRGKEVGNRLMHSEAGRAMVIEHYNATHDKLTGLLNLRGLDEVVKRLGPRIEHAIGIYIDATNLKAVNDRLGHAKGDVLLQEIAALLRIDDYATRLGGDEFFALIMPKEGLNPAEEAEKARVRIERDVLAVLERHPDAAAEGFHVAFGVTLGGVGASIDRMKQGAESEMVGLKEKQHEDVGQYRPPRPRPPADSLKQPAFPPAAA